MNFGHLSEKKENLTVQESKRTEIDIVFAQWQGNRWTFVAVLPDTGFIQSVHSAKRTEEQARVFIQKIKDRSDAQAPLFLSDA